MESNVVSFAIRKNDLVDTLSELLSQAQSGALTSIAFSFVLKNGEIVVGSAGQMDVDKILTGLSEIAVVLSCST